MEAWEIVDILAAADPDYTGGEDSPGPSGRALHLADGKWAAFQEGARRASAHATLPEAVRAILCDAPLCGCPLGMNWGFGAPEHDHGLLDPCENPPDASLLLCLSGISHPKAVAPVCRACWQSVHDAAPVVVKGIPAFGEDDSAVVWATLSALASPGPLRD